MFGAVRGKVKTWLTAGAGTIAAVLIAGLMGAFGALPKPPVPEFPEGQPIETGQWQILPLRAYVSEERIRKLPLKEGRKALVLEVELTNRTAESTKDFFKVFDLPEPLKSQVVFGDPFIALSSDFTMAPELHPALTEKVFYYWQIPRDMAVPERVTFAVTTQIYKKQDNLYGTPGWFNRHEAGRITLPVEAAPEHARAKAAL